MRHGNPVWSEMAQHIKILAINQAEQPEFNPLDLHGKRTEIDSGKLSFDFHMCAKAHTCRLVQAYVGIHNKCNKIFKKYSQQYRHK